MTKAGNLSTLATNKSSGMTIFQGLLVPTYGFSAHQKLFLLRLLHFIKLLTYNFNCNQMSPETIGHDTHSHNMLLTCHTRWPGFAAGGCGSCSSQRTTDQTRLRTRQSPGWELLCRRWSQEAGRSWKRKWLWSLARRALGWRSGHSQWPATVWLRCPGSGCREPGCSLSTGLQVWLLLRWGPSELRSAPATPDPHCL